MSAARHAGLGASLLLGATGTGTLWVGSTRLFMIEAWGRRGMDKPWFFDLWAVGTWIVGPLLIGALVLAGLATMARATVIRSRARQAG